MKRLMLIGQSQSGKTTLVQCLQELPLHYHKTQALDYGDLAIDTPGEYLENRCLYSALITTSYDADVVALVQSAAADGSRFAPLFACAFNKPVIGIITKADQSSGPQQLERACQHLGQAGANTLFITSSLTGEGIAALRAFLA
ncbi:EutP/PduV family microcompartment system protein [Pseudaeromonas sp. ZJS20]|uniref:EutP/PduV family microcompartment system protein n=1 Tax=Pseudaeromonas aegiceratis TaxID=3153928 RepID=UPI00390CD8FF